MGLTQSLHRMVQRAPDAPATIDGDRTRSWREFVDAVARFAGGLHALGLQPGDRVAMLARNGAPFIDYLYGTVWAGGAFNPVNLRWTAREIGFSLENCHTAILFVGAEFASLIPDISAHAPGLRHVLVIGSPDYDAWLAAAEPVADAGRMGDDLAAVLYTSGTTGFPKGVMLSHRNLLASALGGTAAAEAPPADRTLHAAPMFHIGSLSGLFIAMLTGASHVFVPAFEPVAVLDTLVRHRVTEAFLVPTMMRMLIDHPRFGEYDLSHVRSIRYGASPIDEALMARLLAVFPQAGFAQAYGMTELGPIATVLAPSEHVGERRRSAGRASVTCEIRIVGPDDAELPRGDVGEIVCRGENVMLGYWDLPDATAEALRGGWMHTGDMGRMDADGYVTVVDRLKDMIITGGENVYSAEVESALSTHPDVAAVAVIAVPHERWGEAVHAVIVPRPGRTPDAASLDAHARTTLAGFKVPRSFAFTDTLPLSGAGKVLKNVLREAWKRHAAP